MALIEERGRVHLSFPPEDARVMYDKDLMNKDILNWSEGSLRHLIRKVMSRYSNQRESRSK